jgi:DNA polymerase IV
MNSFFASVEQQENPELRGKPVIVAPVMADTSCAIAASYEAKAYGIRTGTGIREAKELCPDLLIVEGQHRSYREYHHRIVAVLNDLFATVKVLSVDEMACRLSPLMRETEEQIGRRVKAAIKAAVGECLTCSVGVAQNIFLAKVASEVQKPDGLTIWRPEDLPGAAYCLELRDFPGIGRKMLIRLQMHGIKTVEQLYAASADDLRRITGSVVGKRWYLMLRGVQGVDYGQEQDAERKSVGHSHVLPPDLRNPAGVEKVILRLLSKALRRLRSYGQAAGTAHLYVRFGSGRDNGNRSYHWTSFSHHHPAGSDDVSWFRLVRALVRQIPPAKPGYYPLMVGVTFTDLCRQGDLTLSLFNGGYKLHALAKAVDALNARFGYVVDLADVYWMHDRAPDRISFGTSLLRTGELVPREGSGWRREKGTIPQPLQEFDDLAEGWMGDLTAEPMHAQELP